MINDLRLAVIIPAYNEEETIFKVLKELDNHLTSLEKINYFEIVVVNDGSSDNTEKIANDNSKTIVITHGFNRGIGAAVRTGLQYVEKNDFDIVIKFDADLQHDPKDIEELIMPLILNKSDLVYGDRFSGKINYKMPSLRKYGNKFFTKLMKLITKYNISDSQPGLFAGNKKFISNVTIFSDYNYTQQVLYSSYLAGLRFVQVPIQFNEREYGQSFVKLSYPFKAMFQILLLIITKNPMKSLGLISLIFLSVSTVITVSELTSYFLGVSPKPIMRVNFVLGTGLVGVQLLITALILKSISNLEKHIRN
tara:strand:+ start:589 stop:1512 length:924 start_codon:yes stop_codon:yes gene_type:complete